VTLTVAPSNSSTTLVYTTDGSVPTTSSATITSSTTLTFDENTTLKVGVLNGDQVENVESYIYTIVDEATTGSQHLCEVVDDRRAHLGMDRGW